MPDKPIIVTDGDYLILTLKHQMRHSARNIGRFRISITSIADPEFIAKIPANLRPLLDVPYAQRTETQNANLATAYRAVSPLLDPIRQQRATLEEQLKALGISTAMIMHEQPGFARPSAYIRERGTFTSPANSSMQTYPAR